MNMLFQWKKYLIPVLVSLLVLSGCSREPSFVDKKWILISHEQRDKNNIKVPVTDYHLTFSDSFNREFDYHLTFYGSFNFVDIEGGCRPGFFKYRIKNNRLRIYNPYTDSFEHMDWCYAMIINSILESGMIYSIEGSTLTLTSYDGKLHKQLTFSETKNYQRISFLKLLGLQILYLVSSYPYIVLPGVIALIVWLVRRKRGNVR